MYRRTMILLALITSIYALADWPSFKRECRSWFDRANMEASRLAIPVPQEFSMEKEKSGLSAGSSEPPPPALAEQKQLEPDGFDLVQEDWLSKLRQIGEDNIKNQSR